MKIELFTMERTQCLYENEVRYNLSESGVAPLSLAEVVPDTAQREKLLAMPLCYPESTGRESLRHNIARFYGHGDPAAVLVTNGGSEANYITLWGLLGERDRVAFMRPNYLQGWGLARAYGQRADPYRLEMVRDDGAWRWRLDAQSLRNSVTPDTRVIVVTNPNNPTGYVLSEEEMDLVVEQARRVGAWILADEIYRGAEINRPRTPTFFGRYDRVIVTGGLSKAFGLPGLRIGWVVAPPRLIERLCRHHDYLTLTPSFISEHLADVVMRPRRRKEILARSRAIIAKHLPVLERWIARHGELFDYARPQAGAIATLRYHLPIASTKLFDRLREERSVLITPGGHFGIGRYLRIGFGYDLGKLRGGLKQMDPLLESLREGLKR